MEPTKTQSPVPMQHEHHKNLFTAQSDHVVWVTKPQVKQQRTHVIQSWMSGDHSTTSDVTTTPTPPFSPNYDLGMNTYTRTRID
jgi:hypothetical protein